MNRSEVAILLGVAAAYDQRTVGEADVVAWHELLGDQSAADAVQAVKNHYATETRRVMPVDVISGVKRIRADRLERNPMPEPDPNMPVGDWLVWHRETLRRIGDGELTTTTAPVIDQAGQARVRQLVGGIGREVPTR